jgi:plasmid stabilization system protein ParE
MIFVVNKSRHAEDDAATTAVWYEARSPGLGSGFLDEVEAALSSLSQNALLHSVRFAGIRCLRLQRFESYGVYYEVMRDEVRVLAVLHGAREIEKLVLDRRSNG